MHEIDPEHFVREMADPIEMVARLAKDRQHQAEELYKGAGDETVRHESDGESRVGIVTETDHEIQDILLSFIHERWPFVSVLAEEDTPARRSFRTGQRYCVLLDPIDGTRNFVDGRQSFCHTVSLMKGSAMLASLVYSHKGDRLFQAIARGGATVSISGATPKELRLGPASSKTFLHHVSRVPSEVIDGLRALGYKTCESRQNATDLLSMFDRAGVGVRGFVSVNPVIYDVWSPAMIVQEAGGWVSDWRGEEPVFRGYRRVPLLLIARTEEDAEAVLPLLNDTMSSGSCVSRPVINLA